jgi:hypothetical protein
VPELRERNIRNIDYANHYLLNEFLPHYWNLKNTVAARDPETRYKPLPEMHLFRVTESLWNYTKT